MFRWSKSFLISFINSNYVNTLCVESTDPFYLFIKTEPLSHCLQITMPSYPSLVLEILHYLTLGKTRESDPQLDSPNIFFEHVHQNYWIHWLKMHIAEKGGHLVPTLSDSEFRVFILMNTFIFRICISSSINMSHLG